MGEERVEGYAEGFKVGWDKAIEDVEKTIDDFCFSGDKYDNIEIKRELKERISEGERK